MIKLNLALCFLYAAIYVANVSCRVPMPQNRYKPFRLQEVIQHPAIITRPPKQSHTLRQQNNAENQSRLGNANQIPAPQKPGTMTKKATTTTTTPEPTEAPEFDDEFAHRRQTTYPHYNNYDYYNYGPTSYRYDYYGNGYGGSYYNYEEGDHEERPTTPIRQQRPYVRPQNRAPKTTTTTTTTTTQPTTPETPEPDDDVIASPTPTKAAISGSGQSSSGSEGYSGFCFCSPLRRCPVGSVPRGGLCDNFLSYFTNLIFIRCCYSPSVARSLQL